MKWKRLYKLRKNIEQVNGFLKDFLGLRRINFNSIAKKVTAPSVFSMLMMVATALGMAHKGTA